MALVASTAVGGEVSVGKAGAERRITNVAAGYASTDAVNVSQLMAEDMKVNGISNNLGNLSNVVNNLSAGGGNLKYFQANSALGSASAAGTNSIAIGGAATASTTNSVALGSNSLANSTTLGTAGYNPGGATLTAATAAGGEVSVGKTGAERRITNVAAGYSGTDAVNVSQLMSEDAKVNAEGAATAASLGGGSSYNPATGAITNPTYNIAGGTYNNVAGALTSIDARLNNIGSNANLKYFHANSSLADSTVTGTDSIAAGPAATASASSAVALGANSVADRANTVSVGSSTAQRQITNMAAGTAAADAVNVSQLSGVTAALGGGATVNPDGSIAAPAFNVNGQTFSNVGDALSNLSNMVAPVASNLKYIRFGPSSAAAAQAAGTDALAIGGNAFANANGSLAIGAGARALGVNSVAMGYGSATSIANTFAVGSSTSTRRIVNVADGVANTDAATVGQVNADIAAAVANLSSSTVSSKQLLASPAVRSTSLLGAPSPSLLGASSLPPDQLLVSGPTDKQGMIEATGTDSMAIGLNTHATADYAIAAGTGVEVGSASSVGIGQNIAVNGTNTVAIGSTVSANGANAVVIGTNGTEADADNAIAIGNNVAVGGSHTEAIGENIIATGSNSVTLGYNSADNGRANIVSVGSSTQLRQIAYVGAGTQNTDAVNVAQLKGVMAALGAGSTVNNDGTITNPTYVIGGSTVTNIASAITSLDARVNANTTDITNLQTQTNVGGINLVTQDATTSNILVASQTGGSIVDFTGTAGARRLTGVAAGKVNASSVDAVNGTQLYNVAASTANAIGGGSTFNPATGTIANPAYVVGGSTVTTIGGAITNLDARVYANTTDITNLQTQINQSGTGMVTQDATSKNILVASQTNGSVVDFTGKAGTRVLSGVAAGVAATDAVNVGQLQAAGIIGPNGQTKAAVTYGTNANGTTNYSSITLGDGTSNAAPVAIHNVAAGTQANDAVNYSQYEALQSRINAITNVGTGVDTLFVGDGNRNTEAAQATGTHATAMGASANASGNQSIAAGYASNASGQNAVAIGSTSTASGKNSVALGAGSVANQDNTVSVGSATQQRRVTNVAAGTQTTDAVNVGQLNEAVASAVGNLPAGMTTKDYTDQQISAMQNSVNQVAKNAYAGVAAAMAMPNLTPSQPGNTVVAAGAGNYKSGGAVGFGATYRSRDGRWLVNGAVSVTTTGDAGVRAQVGYEF
ncbi:YadA family autotransporter adhesin [Paraburkholderia sp. LEh10]|uniref:YadA family autotransporter adhesin n=1 Tax=Paraburkholderia sp. LEh10 TaxID=2821353 RepID=UPI001FD847D0|nr:YadA-like family protein [Paraburkholderia sp. LEh10]